MQYDVVIIGSGFGGSIAANRLALAGLKVLVLERGPWRDTVPVRSMGIKKRAPLPYGMRFLTHFVRTLHTSRGASSAREAKRGGLLEFLAESKINVFKGIKMLARHRKLGVTLNKSGFFEIFRYPGIDVLAVSGVGGGSHGWAGFLIEPLDKNYWSHRHPRLVPADIEKYYDKIRADMKAVRLTKQHAVPNTIWDQLETVGKRCRPTEEQPYVAYKYPLSESDVGKFEVDENGVERQVCRFDGDFYLGSKGGARASVDFIYLAPVLKKGATIREMCEVEKILPASVQGKTGYAVHYKDLRNKSEEVIRAERIIMAAGTMNTFRLLAVSSRLADGLRPMPQLGQAFGGNGDFVGVWHKGTDQPDIFKTTSAVGQFQVDQQESPFMGMIGYAGVDTLPLPPFVKKIIAKTALVLAMGPDSGRGKAKLVDNFLEIDYQPEQEPIFDTIRAAFNALEEDSGKPVTPIGKPITVHQWGVARLGRDPDHGVVDHNGEVYGNPGLYVTDASALPAAPGVPPVMSIAAWAHHVADRLATNLS